MVISHNKGSLDEITYGSIMEKNKCSLWVIWFKRVSQVSSDMSTQKLFLVLSIKKVICHFSSYVKELMRSGSRVDTYPQLKLSQLMS